MSGVERGLDCAAVRAYLLEGADLGAARAHLAACPPCEVLASGLGRALVEARAVATGGADAATAALSPDLAERAARLAAEVERERGLGAALRSRPTWERRLALLVVAAAFGAGTWLLARRTDFAALPPWRVAASIGLLGFSAALAFWHALRPLHRPPLSTAAVALLALPCLAAPVALALLPVRSGACQATEGCFSLGLLLGCPVLLLALALERAPRLVGFGSPLLLGSLGTGTIINLALEGHCAATDPVHMLVGHATLVLVFPLAVFCALKAVGGARAGKLGGR